MMLKEITVHRGDADSAWSWYVDSGVGVNISLQDSTFLAIQIYPFSR